jgi:hypothetical protein
MSDIDQVKIRRLGGGLTPDPAKQADARSCGETRI